ncbi:sugar ABC transporter substrate-binding protein [Actinomadura sp. DC4]|uniref:ABC transporter substrate-binding protein n=1 Tax=Actinomadura sp. DC4 TaxID=3055069 RepID=UPI0025B0DE1A|nr:sugar ABC transporter substrate-binding protein [Actinomadura sp. DC4]MDN3359425.1 sugar ABC transporter substrate-binding protein [Actinomadura sp. DC4]
MRRSLRSVVAVAAAAVIGLTAGCSGGGSDSGKPVKLKFLSLAWQKDSLAANKRLVAEWNTANPGIQVQYIQGSWDNVNDQLVTSFEGGDPPDVIHDDSSALAGFASQGYLTDLTKLIPAGLKNDIPPAAWGTATFAGQGGGDQGIYGVPFLQESQVILANKKMLDDAGVPVPTVANPWTWDQYQQVAKKLTTGKRFGVAWALKAPVNRVLNLALNFGGTFFQTSGGKTTVKVGPQEREVLQRIHDQLYKDKSADPSALGMGTADPLPGFYAGKYAMLPASIYMRQQVVEQAPKNFQWVTIPPLKGQTTQEGAISQTLSVAADSKHPKESVKFISWFLGGQHQVELAKGDWLIPTSATAAKDPSLTTAKDGWDVATASAKSLILAPYLKVNGYDEFKTKVATPALQSYFANKISIDQLAQKLTGDGDKVLARYEH